MTTETESTSEVTLQYLRLHNPVFFCKEAKKLFKDKSYNVSVGRNELTIYRKAGGSMVYMWDDSYDLVFSHFADGKRDIPKFEDIFGKQGARRAVALRRSPGGAEHA